MYIPNKLPTYKTGRLKPIRCLLPWPLDLDEDRGPDGIHNPKPGILTYEASVAWFGVFGSMCSLNNCWKLFTGGSSAQTSLSIIAAARIFVSFSVSS